jgi:hypothetical protein
LLLFKKTWLLVAAGAHFPSGNCQE